MVANFLAIIAGLLAGAFLPAIGEAAFPITGVIIGFVKCAALPLVFFLVIESVCRESLRRQDFGKLAILFSINGSLALVIGMTYANFLQPGLGLREMVQASTPASSIDSMPFIPLLIKQFPQNPVSPFLEANMIGIVILALAIAVALRSLQGSRLAQFENLLSIVEMLRLVAERILIWIVKLIPLAVFASISHVVSKFGTEALVELSSYAAICIAAMLTHIILVYQSWVKIYAGQQLGKFWRLGLQPILLGFGVNSSLVALPDTLRVLERLGISRRASSLVACVGTNLNNDGIILYEAFTFLVIAQAMGIDMPISSQIAGAALCVLASMGVAGVPEAGIIALTLVMSTFGIPTETIAIFLAVDWLIARCRSATNVAGDLAGSIAMERLMSSHSKLTRSMTNS